jgi:hypothetical protein
MFSSFNLFPINDLKRNIMAHDFNFAGINLLKKLMQQVYTDFFKQAQATPIK